uniref:Uncharacterized protein LOC111099855 n=1 Tax=Crassostrea virginica TaxID=6565 RepID=A0A8B8A7A1_CRAVI|nr:uncharacterized protein LOC111099855 [Crassostrea virginica]
MDKCLWSLRQIEGACKTYFISLRDSERRKEKGKDKEHAVNSRLLSRRRERAARLKKTIRGVKEEALHGISRDKLLKVMESEYLSSEESDLDEDGNSFFKVRRLRWQRDTFRELKDHLEYVHRDQLTPQYQAQLKKREVVERFSSRGAPEDCPKFVRRNKQPVLCLLLIRIRATPLSSLGTPVSRQSCRTHPAASGSVDNMLRMVLRNQKTIQAHVAELQKEINITHIKLDAANRRIVRQEALLKEMATAVTRNGADLSPSTTSQDNTARNANIKKPFV